MVLENSEPKPRVLVAMSGGVDSSVAAALLHEQGYDLVGVTLHLWDAEGEHQVGRCCAPEDRDDARRTCEHLGIPHFVIDEREAFRKHVVEPFIEEYQNGRTPIPCVHCNRTVKLVHLAQVAERFGASHIATGHYARLSSLDDGRVRLLRGVDLAKDQSYFLFGVPEHVLRKMIFPLGEYKKPEVRAHGRRLGVPNADKPDSLELCFVPDGDVGGFVEREGRQREAGRFLDEEGRVIGTHAGVESFTLGQRRGLGIGGGGAAKYVLKILPESGDVILGSERGLYRDDLEVRDVHWVRSEPEQAFSANVRIRYRHEPAAATVAPTKEGFSVRFAEPQRAGTPGQAAVVYREDEVIGGGFIA